MAVVTNKNRTSKNESKSYVYAQSVIDGKEVDMLLTIAEAKRAMTRAKKNPEDIPAKKALSPVTDSGRCCWWGKICRLFRHER